MHSLCTILYLNLIQKSEHSIITRLKTNSFSFKKKISPYKFNNTSSVTERIEKLSEDYHD